MGDIQINTDSLTISDRGLLNIRGTSSGSPGNLSIKANTVELNKGTINAENSSAKEGGNINLQVQDNLTLQGNSIISAQAFNLANGGNINIDANFVLAVPNQNSNILANAFTGNGGNINIAARGVFGIQEGISEPSNFTNDIDANSEFGQEGQVSLVFPQFTATEGLFNLTPDFIDANYLFKNNFCQLSRDSKYIVTGRGGIPMRPEDDLTPEHTWSDWRVLNSPQEAETNKIEAVEKVERTKRIEMIRGWTTDRRGKVILTSEPLIATPNQSRLGTPNCNQR